MDVWCESVLFPLPCDMDTRERDSSCSCEYSSSQYHTLLVFAPLPGLLGLTRGVCVGVGGVVLCRCVCVLIFFTPQATSTIKRRCAVARSAFV